MQITAVGFNHFPKLKCNVTSLICFIHFEIAAEKKWNTKSKWKGAQTTLKLLKIVSKSSFLD